MERKSKLISIWRTNSNELHVPHQNNNYLCELEDYSGNEEGNPVLLTFSLHFQMHYEQSYVFVGGPEKVLSLLNNEHALSNMKETGSWELTQLYP